MESRKGSLLFPNGKAMKQQALGGMGEEEILFFDLLKRLLEYLSTFTYKVSSERAMLPLL